MRDIEGSSRCADDLVSYTGTRQFAREKTGLFLG